MNYIFEFSNFYKEGDTVLIHYWYNNMICPVKIVKKIKRSYEVSHNIPQSKIQNAPNEIIKSYTIIDHFRN